VRTAGQQDHVGPRSRRDGLLDRGKRTVSRPVAARGSAAANVRQLSAQVGNVRVVTVAREFLRTEGGANEGIVGKA